MNNGTEPNLGLPWWCPRQDALLVVTQTGLWSLPLRLVTLDETGKSRLRQKSPLPQQWPAAMPVWGGGQYFTQEKSGTTWSEMRHVPNIKGVGVGHLILLSLIGLCVFFFFYLVFNFVGMTRGFALLPLSFLFCKTMHTEVISLQSWLWERPTPSHGHSCWFTQFIWTPVIKKTVYAI